MSNWHVFNDDVFDRLTKMPKNSVQCVVTSPPYWALRDYQVKGQIGLERTQQKYIDKIVNVFREVRRVLKNDGTLWLNLGDSFSNKQLVGMPWKVAFALQDDGWILRQDIIWHKPNPMPESVRDRCTKAHEYIFLFSKSANYVYNQDAIREQAPETVLSVPAGWDTDSGSHGNFHKDGRRNTINRGVQRSGLARALADDVGHNRSDVRTMGSRNKRSVWTVPTQPFPDAHFATFPPDLIRPCILAGSFPGGLVLDPFSGSGTTGVVCMEEGRRYIGIELNPDYVELSEKRIRDAEPQWFGEAAGL